MLRFCAGRRLRPCSLQDGTAISPRVEPRPLARDPWALPAWPRPPPATPRLLLVPLGPSRSPLSLHVLSAQDCSLPTCQSKVPPSGGFRWLPAILRSVASPSPAPKCRDREGSNHKPGGVLGGSAIRRTDRMSLFPCTDCVTSGTFVNSESFSL